MQKVDERLERDNRSIVDYEDTRDEMQDELDGLRQENKRMKNNKKETKMITKILGGLGGLLIIIGLFAITFFIGQYNGNSLAMVNREPGY